MKYVALPRERVRHELPESERLDPLTGKLLVPVGTKITEELEYRPAMVFIREHEQVLYGLSEEDSAQRQACTLLAPLPPRLIEGALAGAGLLVRVLVAKYVDHLPLHRQEGIFARDAARDPRLLRGAERRHGHPLPGELQGRGPAVCLLVELPQP